jgi:hypothetical protein
MICVILYGNQCCPRSVFRVIYKAMAQKAKDGAKNSDGFNDGQTVTKTAFIAKIAQPNKNGHLRKCPKSLKIWWS